MKKEWWKHPVVWVSGALTIFVIYAINQPKTTLEEMDKAAAARATRAACRDLRDNAGPWPYASAERRATMASICLNQ